MVVTVRFYKRAVRRQGNELIYFIPGASGYVDAQIDLKQVPRERLVALLSVTNVVSGPDFNLSEFQEFLEGLFTTEQINQIITVEPS